MSIRLQMILIVICILLFLYLISQIRKRVVSVKHSLAWILLDIILLILSIFPKLLVDLGKIVGVETPSNMLFLFGFILMFMVMYSHTVALSRLNEKQKRLVQSLALDEYNTLHDISDYNEVDE